MIETTQAAQEIKTCCANLYESDWANLLLGDSFHPGGLALTQRLGELLNLQPGQRVLDVAAGKGTSAVFLARQFGCEVVGIDYGAEAVAEATALAEREGLANRVQFEQGDAEGLRFANGRFDAVICECAFCTFPDKTSAAREFARVLRPDGRVGLSDLTCSGPLPQELETLLAWIACIADAQPIDDYVAYLEQAGFMVEHVEPHNTALETMVKNVQIKLLGAEIMVKLKKIDLPAGIDLKQAKTLARHTAQAVGKDRLGYALLVGTRPVISR